MSNIQAANFSVIFVIMIIITTNHLRICTNTNRMMIMIYDVDDDNGNNKHHTFANDGTQLLDLHFEAASCMSHRYIIQMYNSISDIALISLKTCFSFAIAIAIVELHVRMRGLFDYGHTLYARVFLCY